MELNDLMKANSDLELDDHGKQTCVHCRRKRQEVECCPDPVETKANAVKQVTGGGPQLTRLLNEIAYAKLDENGHGVCSLHINLLVTASAKRAVPVSVTQDIASQDGGSQLTFFQDEDEDEDERPVTVFGSEITLVVQIQPRTVLRKVDGKDELQLDKKATSFSEEHQELTIEPPFMEDEKLEGKRRSYGYILRQVMVNAYNAIEEAEYSISGSLAETERLYNTYLSAFGCYGCCGANALPVGIM